MHARTHNCFTALRTLSRTTRVSWYQKKHSPSHTYHGHQSSLICFINLLTIYGILPVQSTCLMTVFLADRTIGRAFGTVWRLVLDGTNGLSSSKPCAHHRIVRTELKLEVVLAMIIDPERCK